MPRRKAPEELSVEELRRLLIEKRRGTRRERLEHFRRTGRVVAPELTERRESTAVVETPESLGDQGSRRVAPVSARRRAMDGILLGVEILAGFSAPTSLGVELADKIGITLIGLVRGNKGNIYTHPDRVQFD